MKKSFHLLLIAVFISSPLLSTSQEDPFSPPPPPPNDGDVRDVPETQNVPFDGGLAVLLATGAGYGLARIRNSRKV